MAYTPAMRLISRRFVGLLASAATAATLLVTPAVANAQVELPGLSSGSSDAVDAVDAAVRDSTWDTRNAIHQETNMLNPQTAAAIRNVVDAAVDSAFPGMINERTAAALPAPTATRIAEPAPIPAFDYGSCPADATACIDLNGRRTWLQNNGQVYYGDVYMSAGREGWETPTGTYWVNRKVKDEVSYEFNEAPMPYSVYFTYNGIAFHEGDPNVLSHGCIHLSHNDAVTFFNELQIGDKVYVY
ncbi:L,D-transpeptidase [Corynebacterium alimapuense]